MLTSIFGRTKSGQGHTDERSTHADERPDVLEIESLAEDTASRDEIGGSASPKGQSYVETLYPVDWSKRFECMCELIVDRKADPSDVVQVYQTLNEGLDADILYVNPTVRGMSIVCGIKDLGAFINSLPNMPILESWALTHP